MAHRGLRVRGRVFRCERGDAVTVASSAFQDIDFARINRERLIESIACSAVLKVIGPLERGRSNNGPRARIAAGIGEWSDWDTASRRVVIDQDHYLTPPDAPILAWLGEASCANTPGTASSRRPAQTGDLEPHTDRLAPGQGELPHHVRPLGSRSDACPPPARRLAHPAGTPHPDHLGRSAREQAGRTGHESDRRQARRPAQARPTLRHLRRRW